MNIKNVLKWFSSHLNADAKNVAELPWRWLNAECVVMPSHINRIIMISMQVSHSHSGGSIYQYGGHKTSCRTKDINEWIRLDRLRENSRMHQPFTKPMIIIIKANRLIFSVVSVMRIAFRIRNVASFFINFGCHFRTFVQMTEYYTKAALK